MKDDTREIDGLVLESLPNTMFMVETAEGKVLTTLKGILRRRYVRIFPGDRVRIEVTKYDAERGRIIQKYKK